MIYALDSILIAQNNLKNVAKRTIKNNQYGHGTAKAIRILIKDKKRVSYKTFQVL